MWKAKKTKWKTSTLDVVFFSSFKGWLVHVDTLVYRLCAQSTPVLLLLHRNRFANSQTPPPSNFSQIAPKHGLTIWVTSWSHWSPSFSMVKGDEGVMLSDIFDIFLLYLWNCV